MTAAVIQVDFAASQAAREARDVRKIVRRAELTKSERDVLLALVNLWFYHRTKAHPEFHPGRKKIAKKSDVSLRTVDSAIVKFKALGVLLVVGYPKGGGRCATRFALDLDRLRDEFDPHGVTAKAGKLVRLPVSGGAFCNPENTDFATLRGAKIATDIRANEPHKKEPKPSETDFDGGDHA